MQTIRNLALGLCLLCAAGGMIRIFWPDNRFKPVINTVLALYILTSMFSAGTSTDWNSVASQIREITVSASGSADYTGYAQSLGEASSAEAMAGLLVRNGIQAQTTWNDGTLYIRLEDEGDREAAETLLRENSGLLPYVFLTQEGEEQP